MDDLEADLSKRVEALLGPRCLENAIVYVNPTMKSSAERVTVGDVTIEMPWEGHIVFVDLEPGVNWGHACLYVAFQYGGGHTMECKACMPPFIKSALHDFHILHRGPRAPEWAVFS